MIKTSDTIRSDRAALESELRQAGATIRGNAATCIFHEDTHASGSIHQGEDGAWRFKCHVPTCAFSGDIFDIQAKLQGKEVGMILKEVNATNTSPRQKPKGIFQSIDEILMGISGLGKIEAHNVYSNPDTLAPEVVQVRYQADGAKKFLVHQSVPGGFVLGAPMKPWPIYNRARIRNAGMVLVVEGEKCVHALHSLGIVATTSLSGASNADKADWSPLAGKCVYIWPDNDEPGSKYAAEVVKQLDILTPKPEIYLLNPSGLGLPAGGDVVDFLEGDGNADAIWQVLNDGSEIVGAHTELLARIHEIVSGKWQSLVWPWPQLSASAKALFPGTITIICGDPAASKSFFIIQAAHWWHKNQIPIAVYELEEDRSFHLLRLLAILSGRWDVLDDTWGRNNPDALKALYEAHRSDIESFSPLLHSAPMGQLSYEQVLGWISDRCRAGAKILVIDPITAVYTGESRQIDDLSFIVKASAILREHQARLVLVTHPRMGSSNAKGRRTQDDLAGGRAFSRHTQTVLWIHVHKPAKKFVCKTAAGALPVSCNRSVHIAKARNAPGHGWEIGFNLGEYVQFTEQGIIIDDREQMEAPAPPAF